MSAGLQSEHRKIFTETVLHGRIPGANDATGNTVPVPFDLGTAQALCSGAAIWRGMAKVL